VISVDLSSIYLAELSANSLASESSFQIFVAQGKSAISMAINFQFAKDSSNPDQNTAVIEKNQ
jgi:hypothetical protein